MIVCLLIALSWVAVWPVGEYALLDDWAYARSLKTLHDEGRVRLLDWNPMLLIGHLAWGVAWTKALGFSMTTARLSVAALYAVECLALLRLLRGAGVREGLALAATVSLMFNPLHFVHCFTFMTDIPALAWTVVALWGYARALTRSSGWRPLWLLVGSLASGMAFLTRQNGLLIPAAMLAYAVLWDRTLLRPRLLVPAFVPAAATIAMAQWWYFDFHGATTAYQASLDEIRAFMREPPWSDLPFIAFTGVVYLGWLALPFSAGLVAIVLRRDWTPRMVVWLAFAWLVLNATALFIFVRARLFPYIWNVITPFGFFDPDALYTGRFDIRWGDRTAFWVAVLCVLSALVLSRAVVGVSPAVEAPGPMRPVRRLAAMLLALQAAYCLATAPILFDRHLLIMAPAALVVLATYAAEVRVNVQPALFAACLAPAAAYSVAATHDLHAASRAVWKAGADLVAAGADPAQVNAGYAFDGWHTYDRMRVRGRLTHPQWWDPEWSWMRHVRWRLSPEQLAILPAGWWFGLTRPAVPPQYVVAVAAESDLPALESVGIVRDRVSFRTWWPWAARRAVVVERRPQERVGQ